MRQAVIQADRAGVLSANETVEDIATSDLKYVMCNFYLASIVSRTRTPGPAARAPGVLPVRCPRIPWPIARVASRVTG